MNNRTLSAENIGFIINIILLALGIILICIPNEAMGAITIILGIILVGYGGITLAVNIVKKNDGSLLMPILCLILGLILLAFNSFFANTALPLIVGIWMIVMGVIGMANALHNKILPGWKFSLVLSLAAIALGIIILAGLSMTTNVVGILMGVCMVLYGATAIVNWVVIRRMNK